jgi:hypothetical protein
VALLWGRRQPQCKKKNLIAKRAIGEERPEIAIPPNGFTVSSVAEIIPEHEVVW